MVKSISKNIQRLFLSPRLSRGSGLSFAPAWFLSSRPACINLNHAISKEDTRPSLTLDPHSCCRHLFSDRFDEATKEYPQEKIAVGSNTKKYLQEVHEMKHLRPILGIAQPSLRLMLKARESTRIAAEPATEVLGTAMSDKSTPGAAQGRYASFRRSMKTCQ